MGDVVYSRRVGTISSIILWKLMAQWNILSLNRILLSDLVCRCFKYKCQMQHPKTYIKALWWVLLCQILVLNPSHILDRLYKCSKPKAWLKFSSNYTVWNWISKHPMHVLWLGNPLNVIFKHLLHWYQHDIS
jgi:hypothetical protein